MATRPYRAWRFLHPDLDAPDAEAGLQVGPTGRVEMIDGEASVRQAILLLLTTLPGERVMRPDYGCDLSKLAFSPNDDTTAGLAIYYVRRAIDRWEPRVEILRLDAECDVSDASRLTVTLEYRLRATGRTGRVALPVDLSGEV